MKQVSQHHTCPSEWRRVPVGDSYLVDYHGPRPDTFTEGAMQRILDAPLMPPRNEGESSAAAMGARWMRGHLCGEQGASGGDDDDVGEEGAEAGAVAGAGTGWCT